jgi:transcriptional regulator with XRE-family HTH domain
LEGTNQMREHIQNYRLPRNYTAVGEYLRYLRTKAGLTQREVSLELGYSSAQFISNFERGIALPPLKKLKVMQKIYRGNLSRLVDLTIEAERRILVEALKRRSKDHSN